MLNWLKRNKEIVKKQEVVALPDTATNDVMLQSEARRAAVEKKAKAYDPNFDTWNLGNVLGSGKVGSRHVSSSLTFTEREEIASLSSTVAAIERGIVRHVTSFNYAIVNIDEDEPEDKNTVKDIQKFFMKINENNESLTSINKKFVRNCIIHNDAVIEKDLTGATLNGIYARSPEHFYIIKDQHGIIQKHVQVVTGRNTVTFEPNEIIHTIFEPNTESRYGMPTLNSLVNEISAQLFSSQLIARSFEYDEVPPGILNLGKIGQVAYERAREYFKDKRQGGKRNFELSIVHDTDKVEWIPLSRPPAELQLSELLDKVNRMIFRCFGVMPVEMGDIKETNYATSKTQESISQSKLIIPILNALEEYINNEIIWPHFSEKSKIIFKKPREDAVILSNINSYVQNGLISRNEGRKLIGEKAIDGGDDLVVHTNTGIWKITPSGEYENLTPSSGFSLPGLPLNEPEGEDRSESDTLLESKPEQIDEPDNPIEEDIEKRIIYLYKDDGEKKTDLEIVTEYVEKFAPKTIDIQKAFIVSNDVTGKMQKIWIDKKESLINDVVKAYPNKSQVKGAIYNLVSALLRTTQTAFRNNVRASFDDGVETAKAFDKDLNPNKIALDGKYNQAVKKDEQVIEDVLFNGKQGLYQSLYKKVVTALETKRKLKKNVSKITKQDETDLYNELEDVYDTFIEKRLPGYGIKTWAFAHIGLLAALSQSDKPEVEKGYLVNTSGEPCPTCEFYSANSPYPIDNFPYVPKSGASECKKNCYCIIEISDKKPPFSLAGQKFRKI